MAEISDDERIAQAAGGDRNVLEQLLVRHYDMLHAHIVHRIPATLRSLVGPEDVLQQACIEAFRDIVRFRPKSSASFTRWLKTICEHQLLDCIRTQQRQKRGGNLNRVEHSPEGVSGSFVSLLQFVADDDHTPLSVVQQREAAMALHVALAGLDDDAREAVRICRIEGRGIDEAAEVLGRTPDAIRGLLHRAQRRLREAMVRSSLWLNSR